LVDVSYCSNTVGINVCNQITAPTNIFNVFLEDIWVTTG